MILQCPDASKNQGSGGSGNVVEFMVETRGEWSDKSDGKTRG